MLRPRLTVLLMMHQNALYKSINFSNPIYIGDPLNAVRIFNDFYVDELIFVNIDATVNSLEPDYRLLEDVAFVSRMPLCYGGGIKQISQIEKIIALGFEKISISSGAINNPKLVREAADIFGSQSIVGCIDIRKDKKSENYFVYTHNGSRIVNMSPIEVVDLFIESGVGEILVNNISRDGTYKGYDIGIIEKIVDHSSVPVTAVGGARSFDDLKELSEACGLMGVAAGSLWCFKEPNKAVLLNYPNPRARIDIFSSN